MTPMQAACFLVLGALTACFDPRYGSGVACSEVGTCPPGLTCGNDGLCSTAPAHCGDGVIRGSETCDDGDVVDTGNGCSATCARNDACGDGVRQSLFESCDRALSASCNETCTGEHAQARDHRIGGTVQGLVGAGLRLAIEGGEILPIADNGAFAFATRLPSGSRIRVLVDGQPFSPDQHCDVHDPTRTVTGDITDLTVTCRPPEYRLLLDVEALVGGMSLTMNTRTIPVAGRGTVELDRLPPGATYAVDVLAYPDMPVQACSITGNHGTMGEADATVHIHCVPGYRVGGRVLGLAPGNTVLLQFSGETFTQASDGAFRFRQPLPLGVPYEMDARLDPASPVTQRCSAGATSTGPSPPSPGDIESVIVNCTSHFDVGGYVQGLAPSAEVRIALKHGSVDLPTRAILGNDTFAFAEIPDGAPYHLAIKTQPRGQVCSVHNGNGVVRGANVTNIGVICEDACFVLHNGDREDLGPIDWFDPCVTRTGSVVTVRLVDADGYTHYVATGSKRGAMWTAEQMTSTADPQVQWVRNNHERLVPLDTGDVLMITARSGNQSGCGPSIGNGYGIFIADPASPFSNHFKLVVASYRQRDGNPRAFKTWSTAHEISWRRGATMDTCGGEELVSFPGSFAISIASVSD